jgi:hypothetical protein
MGKLALLIWTLIPRKIEQSILISGNAIYCFDFVWLGKHFKAQIKKK